MVAFRGRSRHTIKQKAKPIQQGYKVWCLGSQPGYYYDWLLYSPKDGAEDCQRKNKVTFARQDGAPSVELSETFQIPLVLLKKLQVRLPH